MSHNKNGIRAFLTRFVTSLGHTTEIFSEGRLPDFFGGRVVHEFFIAADRLPSCGMDHWHRDLFQI